MLLATLNISTTCGILSSRLSTPMSVSVLFAGNLAYLFAKAIWSVCLQRQFGLSVCKDNLACLFAKKIWPVCWQRRQLHLQVKPLQRCTTPQKHCALEALSSLACPQTGLLQSLTWLSPQPCHHPVHIKPAHLDPPHSQVIDHLKPRMLSRTL